MEAEPSKTSSQAFAVIGLLLSLLLSIAIFLYGVLGWTSISAIGSSVPAKEHAADVDDAGTYGQW